MRFYESEIIGILPWVELAIGGQMSQGLKSAVLIAVISSLITGVLALVPNFWDRYLAPSVRVEYQGTLGPSVPTKGEFRQTFLLTVRNSGGRESPPIQVRLRVSTGKLDDFGLILPFGVTSKENQVDSQSIEFEINSLNQGENFSIAVLYTSSQSAAPQYSVRSTGITPIEVSTNRADAPGVGLKSTAFSVILGPIAAVLVIFLLRKLPQKSAAKVFSTLDLHDKRRDVIRYAFGRIGLLDWFTQNIGFNREVSYLAVADIALSRAPQIDSNTKEKIVIALLSLLVISQIRPDSREVLIRSIKLIDGKKASEEIIRKIVSIKSGSSFLEVRDAIDEAQRLLLNTPNI